VHRRSRLSLGLGLAAVVAGAPLATWAAIGSPSAGSPAAPVPPPAAVVERLDAELGAASDAASHLAFVHGADLGAAEEAVATAGLTLVDTFDRIGVAVATGTPDQLRAAAGAAGVTRVELDTPIELALDTSHVATRGEEALRGFEVTTTETVTTGKGKQGKGKQETSTVTRTETSAPLDGSGVSIAVIDSGIDGTHPFFLDAEGNSKVVRNLKFACVAGVLIPLQGPCIGEEGDAVDELFVDAPANDSDTGSLGGHGTHVAGIAGGGYGELSDGRPLHGAAPGAKLVGISVGAVISVYGGTAGMNWVLEHHAQPCGPDADATACPPIKVVNNSWGGGGQPYDPEDVTAKLQDALVADGVTVVWAAGNDGGDGTTRNIDGPAQSPTPGVLSVANYDDGDTGTRDGALDSSSSRGYEPEISSYPDLSAPGATITSSCRPYLPICYLHGSTGDGNQLYYNLGGTSMAAPHIAGIVAQLLQADPTLTPGEIEDVLEDTAYPFAAGAPYVDDTMNPGTKTSFDKGHGLVDVVAAVARVRGLSAWPEATQPCTPDGPMAVDPAGDANTVLDVPTPADSEPALDVIEGRMDWDGTALTFTTTVLDLGTEPLSNGSDGESFRSFVDLAGVQYTIDASRDSLGESYNLSGGVAGDSFALTGSFDPATDEIAVVIPAGAFAALGGPTLADGVVLSNLQILGRRSLVVLAPPVDTANATCPYTIGAGAVPPPAEPPSDGGGDGGTGGEPDGDVEAVVAPGGSFAWSGEPRTEVTVGNNVFGVMEVSPVGVETGLTECDLNVAGNCEEHKVHLSVPAEGATVTISLTPTSPGAIDLDVLLLDADGRQVASAETAEAAETLTAALTKAGTYTIRIRHYATVEATYDGLLTLA
jgi:subtilisin family serine protease